MPDHDTIAVIDFGGQYAHLIATKVRRLGILAEIRQPEDPIEVFTNYRGIIISGVPAFPPTVRIRNTPKRSTTSMFRSSDSASAIRRSRSTMAARSYTAAGSGARPIFN